MAVGNQLETLMREREHTIEGNDSEDSREPLIARQSYKALYTHVVLGFKRF